MSDKNQCLYCSDDTKKLDDLMILIASLKVSRLLLFREQTHKGRCIVTYNDHDKELFDLTDKELELYMQDVKTAALAINKTFSPDKINFGAYSDNLPHLHFHIVPKYKDGAVWGSTFEMMPEKKVFLTEDEYIERVKLIKENL